MKELSIEEKFLLFQDISARLPYGVICTDSRHGDSRITQIDINPTSNEISVYYWDFDEYGFIENCKPYLRPMSSMTEEERQELIKEFWGSHTISDSIEEVHWYLKKHFDIRGLIEKGLALPAPTDMYNVK